jgi:outer membrane immunogenic protein
MVWGRFRQLFEFVDFPLGTVFRRVCPTSNSILSGSGYSPFRFWESVHSRGRVRRFHIEDLNMKKLVLALSAIAAFTGSAIAADLPARTYSKAPAMVAAVPSWTGCYVGGGGGFGVWNQENTGFSDRAALAGLGPRVQTTDTSTAGGRGYFGTVQGGCDYQFAGMGQQFVIGAQADYDFSSLKGHLNLPVSTLFGDEKQSSSWAAGGRIGWLAFPTLLTYFSAGYTQAHFDGVNFHANLAPAPIVFMNSRTYNGWYLGAGDEYALSFLPGLFWKTEYRFSEFDTRTNPFFFTGTNTLTTDSMDSKKWVQSVRSELVYRFNWGGPVVARY